MSRILVNALLIALCVSHVTHARSVLALQAPAAKSGKAPARQAPRGFYLEIKRSYVRAYPGWQKKTIALLKAAGFAAFNGKPRGRVVAGETPGFESIEQTAKPVSDIGAVYVGPYHTREEAEARITSLLAALKPLIDDEKKGDGLHNRHLFLVGVMRVR